jgi:predicted glycoside hydrolase/deacetylase ChbG (UPF0249 family)
VRRLIVNADDLGLHRAVNDAVAEGARRGFITSASLVANGEAAEEAIRLARELHLDVGAHLNVSQGRPLRRPAEVPSLLDGGGRLRFSGAALALAALSGRVRLPEAESEWRAQLERLLAAGLTLSHLDSHRHAHWAPRLFGLALRLAEEYGIPFVRLPDFPAGGLPGGLRGAAFAATRALAPLYARACRRGGRRWLPALGVAEGGRLDESLGEALGRPWEGVRELVCHPSLASAGRDALYSPGYGGEKELRALAGTLTPEFLRRSGIELTSYRREAGRPA